MNRRNYLPAIFWLSCICWGAVAGRAQAHDLKALPLGDGKISQSPRQSWVWACHVESSGRGAQGNGPWIDTARGTYDLTAKAVVPGNVRWPSKFELSVRNGRRIFSSNDFPSHPTGEFPIPYNSEAWQYDRNPNRISEQNIFLDLPANPELASQPACAPGAVGYLLSGAVLFNALDAPGRDAVAHETQDRCQGHPQERGVYHYHSVSTCIDTHQDRSGHSSLVGYAIDGFGIYGRYGEGGKELASADLDACHGHRHPVMWDGRAVDMYHYHATRDFPYTIGCLRGSYRMQDAMVLSGPNPRGVGVPMPPGRLDQRGGVPGNAGPVLGMPGGMPARHPDLNRAAATLGVDVRQLQAALGPPPPDLQLAGRRLGISVERLREALDKAR